MPWNTFNASKTSTGYLAHWRHVSFETEESGPILLAAANCDVRRYPGRHPLLQPGSFDVASNWMLAQSGSVYDDRWGSCRSPVIRDGWDTCVWRQQHQHHGPAAAWIDAAASKQRGKITKCRRAACLLNMIGQYGMPFRKALLVYSWETVDQGAEASMGFIQMQPSYRTVKNEGGVRIAAYDF